MPSLRSSSASSIRRAGKPAGPRSGIPPYSLPRAGRGLAGLGSPDEAIGELDSGALGDDVEVGAVLDDDRHRALEDALVDVVGAQQQKGARPVDRLGDRRRLL